LRSSPGRKRIREGNFSTRIKRGELNNQYSKIDRSEVHPLYRQFLEKFSDSLHTFDAIHYDIWIDTVDFGNHSISGKVTAHCASKADNLSGIVLHLAQLQIDSISMGSTPLQYTHSGDTITIELGTTFSKGEEFEIKIKYHGQPGNEGTGGFGGFWFRQGVAFSMGVGLNTMPPSMARYWFPCFDEPADKATFDIYITPPAGKLAVANGELVGILEEQGVATYHWRESHPVSTYLISVAVSNYSKIDDQFYNWLYYYVYPQDTAKAKVSFQNVHKMIDCFTGLFSPYHFEKFSYVAAPIGDMEHVTCVTHYAPLINGTNSYDWVLAHELSHQWWGNWVTIGDWRDVWLSEGFATYSEALYQEYLGGHDAYQSYVDTSFMDYYLNSNELFPIYDPLNLWGATTYEKGACVLHMLRHVVGDSVFFQILRNYGNEFAYANALTADFQKVCNTVSGDNLDWFFQEWVYDWGYPVYEYAGAAQGDTEKVSIKQIQGTGPIFKMPIELKLKTEFSDTTVTVWTDKKLQYFKFVLSAPPTGIEFDPDHWILKRAQEVPYGILEGKPAGECSWLKISPDPFRTEVRLEGRVLDAGPVSLKIYDASGRRARTFIRAENQRSRIWSVVWDGKDDVGNLLSSGVYFCRLEAGSFTAMRRMTLIK
jgi:aminopeptidase N